MNARTNQRAHNLTASDDSGVFPRPARDDVGLRPRGLIHVMVVDDDPLTCRAVSTILRARGYQVSVRAEALGTLAAVAREKPDVIVLDVDMKGLTGDALARMLKRKGCEAQIILHSSEAVPSLNARARDAGALGYIEKGDPLTFLPTFEALLGRTA